MCLFNVGGICKQFEIIKLKNTNSKIYIRNG